jgi:predicted small lipoprotein YifL
MPRRATGGFGSVATRAAIAGVALALMTAGCGRKAPPLPPQIIRPDATRDLSVEQVGRRAVLQWSYPAMTSAGGPLPALERIEVWRVTLPAGQEPPAPTSARDRQMRVDVVENQGERIVELGPGALESATRGPRLVLEDDLEAWFVDTSPELGDAVIWYAVRSVCCGDRESDMSNIARLVPRVPPAPPTGLAAEAGRDGIRLTWTSPDDALAVLVERSNDGATWTDVSPQPITTGELLDVTATQETVWRYRVRSVRTGGAGGRVVGPPSAPVEVDHRDRYPPAPPEELVCLPEGRLVRLRWSAVADAAGYRVVRIAAGGDRATIAELVPRASVEDDDPPDGQLVYTVEAVDAAGNASEPVSCTAVAGVVP